MPTATMNQDEKQLTAPPKTSVLASFRAMGAVLAISWPTIFDAMRNRVTKKLVDERCKWLGDRVLQLTRAKLEVEGLENFDPAGSYLFMSNHESLMDIPLIFATAPRPPRMVTKAELFKVPIWGTALRLGGFISVDRKNRTQAIKSLMRAKELMDEGINVWIAPEGTRSRDGSLLPFKKGGFMLALDTGATIVPVGIVGARDVIRPKTFRVFLDQPIKVRYGKPIDASAYGPERRDELMAEVRAQIEELRR